MTSPRSRRGAIEWKGKEHVVEGAVGPTVEVSDRGVARSLLLLWLVAIAWLASEILRGIYASDELLRETYVSATGIWAMRFLIASFAVSPLIRWFKLSWLGPFRRDLGLIGFVFVLAHIVFYIVSVGLFPDHMRIIVRRPYLEAGLVASIALLPLALTSTQHAMQVLGRLNWRRIHTLIYPTLVLTILHESLYTHDHYAERTAHIVLITVLVGDRILAGLRKT